MEKARAQKNKTPIAAAGTQYRDILIHELQLRIQRNPAYSLRAYARDLELAPSGLSRILTGQQGISPTKARFIAEKLELSEMETDYFCSLIEAEHARSQKQRELAKEKLQSKEVKVSELSLDYFKTISDWHYFAIIELTSLVDFRSDPKWMAVRLNLPVDLVKESITRLLKLGLIEADPNGSLKKTKDFRAISSGVPNRTIKNHHQQILKKAETALFEQELSEREFSSTTFAMNFDDLKWAKKEMQEFRRGLTKRLSNRDDKDHLYQLSMQLFALDQKTQTKEKK